MASVGLPECTWQPDAVLLQQCITLLVSSQSPGFDQAALQAVG
jgi:hypothetical protein